MTRTLAILLCLLVGARALAQDGVRLRHLAIVEPRAPVTLGMIADLEGEAASALADVTIIDDAPAELGHGERQATVSIERVRQALRDSGRVDWSALTLRGSACVVRPRGMPAPVARGVDAPRREAPPVLASTLATTTVRGHVARAIARALGVDPSDLRLKFDRRDARLLATSAIGRTVDAGVTGLSDDMPVRVMVYDAERIMLDETLRVGVTVRRSVCVLSTDRSRRETIGKGDFRVERRWLRPTETPIDADDAVGLAPRSRLSAGDLVLAERTELPIIVKRGDLVSVHCVSGSVVVQMPARALEDGRDGEVIELKHLKGEATLRARLSGPGRAVAVPDRVDVATAVSEERRP